MRLSTQTRKNALRGAKIGAVCMGGAAFSTGILICVLHRIPIPPLALTEFGVMFGGLLGAGLGILCSTTQGRFSLVGILSGLLLGSLIALLLAHDAVGILRLAVLGGVIGWRLALNQARARLAIPAWTPTR